jgi:hypothetical protein
MVVRQDQRFGQVRRHFADNNPDILARLADLEFRVRTRVLIGQQIEKALAFVVAAPDLRVERHLAAPRSTAEVVAGLIGRYGEQPRFEPPTGVKPRGRQVNLNKRVLDDVISRRLAVREAKDEPQQLAMVTLDQRAKRGAVAALMVA